MTAWSLLLTPAIIAFGKSLQQVWCRRSLATELPDTSMVQGPRPGLMVQSDSWLMPGEIFSSPTLITIAFARFRPMELSPLLPGPGLGTPTGRLSVRYLIRPAILWRRLMEP